MRQLAILCVGVVAACFPAIADSQVVPKALIERLPFPAVVWKFDLAMRVHWGHPDVDFVGLAVPVAEAIVDSEDPTSGRAAAARAALRLGGARGEELLDLVDEALGILKRQFLADRSDNDITFLYATVVLNVGLEAKEEEHLHVGVGFLLGVCKRDPGYWRAAVTVADALFELAADDALSGRTDNARKKLLRAREVLTRALDENPQEFQLSRSLGEVEIGLLRFFSEDFKSTAYQRELQRICEQLSAASKDAPDPVRARCMTCHKFVLEDLMRFAYAVQDPPDWMAAALPSLQDDLQSAVFDGVGEVDFRNARWLAALHLRNRDEWGLFLEAAQTREHALALCGLRLRVVLARKDHASARRTAELLVEIEQDPEAILLAASAFALLGDPERAAEELRGVVESNAREARYEAALAVAIMKSQGVTDESVRLLRGAVVSEPSLACAQFALGTALTIQGEKAGAVEALSVAAKLYEGDPENGPAVTAARSIAEKLP